MSSIWQPVEWQPIETAPTGKMILAWDGEDVEVVEWHPSLVSGGLWFSSGGPFEATHWMPLPEPPKGET